MEKYLRGRIIYILNDETVLINIGKNQGVMDRDSFYILSDTRSYVIDRYNNKVLDDIIQYKQEIYVEEIRDNYTICKSISRRPEFCTVWKSLSQLPEEEIGIEMNIDYNDIENPLEIFNHERVKCGDVVEKVSIY